MSRGSSLDFVYDCDKLKRVDERNGLYYSRKEAACLAMRDISSVSRSCDKISVSVNLDMQSLFSIYIIHIYIFFFLS